MELIPESWQEKAIIKRIKETIGDASTENLLIKIKDIISKRLVIFSSHALRERMPDPSRYCTNSKTAISKYKGEEIMPTISLELFKMGDKKSFDYALEKMSCICGGIASPAYIDITYRFNDKVIVVKNVPVLRCENCEEIYSDALIEKRVEELAYKAMQEHKSFISFTDF